MKKMKTIVLIISMFAILTGCAATILQFEMQEPQAGNTLVVGAVLVENNGIDDVYEATKSKIIAIVVGKHMKNGEEVIEGYRLQTDENGYFYLPNVPQGAYVLKGIEVNVGYSGPMLISSRWDGPRQIFIPGGQMINYVVRNWPEKIKKPILDMGITYIMVDLSQRIYSDHFPALDNNVLALQNTRHTMVNPKDYFREKYPGIQCLQK
jgi:hypothetical protein